MAEITEYAYKDLRNYIQSKWNYIELQGEDGTPIVRLTLDDSRITWVHEEDATELKLQIAIKGSDADITVGTTVAKSAIFDSIFVEQVREKTGEDTMGRPIYKVITPAQGVNPCTVEVFTPFTIESENDELTVIHSIQVPLVTV